MALLNWGNALSQAGKAMATVGLEGVKSTLEHDKVRLAAKLAADESLLSDTRRATAAIGLATLQGSIAATAAGTLAGVNTETARQLAGVNTETAKQLAATNKLTAEALVKAKLEDPAELAALNASLSAKALNEFTLSNAKAVNHVQTQLAAITGTDPASMSQKALLKQQLTAMGTTAASISADKTGAAALYTSSAAKYISATAERVKAAAALNLDPENADAIEASRAAIDAEQDTKRIYDASVNYLRETNPEFKISSLSSDPRTGTPAPAPGAGTGTATPEAPDKRDTLPDGTPITEALSGPGRVLRAVGVRINKAVTADSERGMDEAIAIMAPTYKAAADEINRGIENSTREGATLPPNYRKNLRVLLSTPEYRGYLSPAAVAVAERFKAQDAAGLSKPGSPSASGGTPSKVISYRDLP